MKHTTLFLIVPMSLIVPACAGGDITQTGGEFAEELNRQDCEDGARCDFLNSTVPQCTIAKTQAYCDQFPVECVTEYTANEDDWTACLDALSGRNCDDVYYGIFPSVCDKLDNIL